MLVNFLKTSTCRRVKRQHLFGFAPDFQHHGHLPHREDKTAGVGVHGLRDGGRGGRLSLTKNEFYVNFN